MSWIKVLPQHELPPGVGRLVGALSRQKTLPTFPTRISEDSIWVDLEDTP